MIVFVFRSTETLKQLINLYVFLKSVSQQQRFRNTVAIKHHSYILSTHKLLINYQCKLKVY